MSRIFGILNELNFKASLLCRFLWCDKDPQSNTQKVFRWHFKSSADVMILGVLQIGIRATVIENQVFWTLDYNYTFKTDHFYKIPPYALRAYAFPTSGRDITFTWFLIYVNML